MHIDFHAFFQENFITIALILGVAIATFSSRKSPIPAIGTIWIIIALLTARTFLGFVNQYASDFYPEATDIRYATTVAEYLINPFILLMEILMLTRDRIVKLLLWIPAVINTLMLLVMPRFGYVPAYYAYNYQFRVGPLRYANLYIVIFYLLCFVVFSIMYFKNYKQADRNMIWFVFILSALAIFLETENIITGYINAVIAVDLLFYYMFLNMAYQTQLEERVLKQELELTQTNVRLMQEQISPHFIFNALYIIKALVWVDKKKASEAIESFSVYLRRNIDSLKSSELIPFESELEHIKAFLAIETADESKPINITYDVQESDFRIPALTAEPLVENAIIHGIFKIKEPGELKISTYKDDSNYVVEIRDNGPGFEERPSAPGKERRGVGINNVRTRMQLQCNGTLEFENTGSGTCARLKIPFDHA